MRRDYAASMSSNLPPVARVIDLNTDGKRAIAIPPRHLSPGIEIVA
jgi:hypothetical protein